METLTSAGLRLSVPDLSARVSPHQVASLLARLIASRAAVTQADLVRVTGLSRSTVSAALELLDRRQAVRRVGTRPTPGRGRSADLLGLNPRFGLVLVADVGAHAACLTVNDLGQTELARRDVRLDIAAGPTRVLDEITGDFRAMLDELPTGLRPLVIVIGLPGPMDTRRGTPVKPPIMPGWDAYPVSEQLADDFGCPVLLENDVNLRALGEARALPPEQSPLLYVKVSTGIGGGLVTANGELHHGADGAAGDIGHVRVAGADDALCACGNYGCVEALASASAIIGRLRQLRSDAPNDLDGLTALLRAGDKVTVGMVRSGAEQLGEVVASLVHFFNPARVVVGGGLAVASDDVLAGVRAVVYRRSLPLATRNLVISQPVLGRRSGTAGGIVLGIEAALSVNSLTAALSEPARR